MELKIYLIFLQQLSKLLILKQIQLFQHSKKIKYTYLIMCNTINQINGKSNSNSSKLKFPRIKYLPISILDFSETSNLWEDQQINFSQIDTLNQYFSILDAYFTYFTIQSISKHFLVNNWKLGLQTPSLLF